MGGKFDRTPWAAGYPDYKYGTSSATPLLGRLASDAGLEEREAEYNKVLWPVLDFLLFAAVLLPLKLWWNLAEEQCWDPSSYKATELTLLRVTRGVWIAWLTHAAGLIDEALRVFLGIRLTMGLGSPTSVDKTYTKMSRRAEIVAEVRERLQQVAFTLLLALNDTRRVFHPRSASGVLSLLALSFFLSYILTQLSLVLCVGERSHFVLCGGKVSVGVYAFVRGPPFS